MWELKYSDVPYDFEACIFADCPLATNCLRQLAFGLLAENQKSVRIVSPKLCSKDDGCAYFRDSQPVVYARGFVNLQQAMLPKQYKTFMRVLEGKFGRNNYFALRRGEKPLSPKDQAVVREVLRKVGGNDELEFDGYEEAVNWND